MEIDQVLENQNDSRSALAEQAYYSKSLTNFLLNDADLSPDLPISPLDLPEKLKSGIVLCKLINYIKPDTIRPSSIILKNPCSPHQQKFNLNLAINSLRFLDPTLPACSYKSILSSDHEVISEILWRIFRFHYLKQVSAENYPGLAELLHPGEDLSNVYLLNPESCLLKWVNFCLGSDGNGLENLEDIGLDSVLKVGGKVWGNEFGNSVQWVVDRTIEDDAKEEFFQLCLGESMKKFRIILIAQMFKIKPPNSHSPLVPLIQAPREEIAFRKWINSLNIKDLSSEHLCLDLSKSNTKLLKLLNILTNNSTNLADFLQNPENSSSNTKNWDLFWQVGKTLGFSLNSNIPADPDYIEILNCVWEVIKFATLSFIGLKNEENLLAWVNSKLSVPLINFSDQAVRNGCLLELIEKIDLRVLENEKFEGDECGGREDKAKILVSGIRKLGGRVYFSYEDIAEGNPRITLVVCAILYHLNKDYELE